jgi:SAM-dependent methyltransferase
MLKYGMRVVGVDPLNEPYRMLLARHGLDRLEAIHPTLRIGGLAETFSWPRASCELVFSCNALDHTQDLPAAMGRIRDILRPGGIAALTVYTREDSRENFEGLHKYDIWVEDGTLMFSSREEPSAPLLMGCHGLRLLRVVSATELSLAVVLARD